MRARVCNLVGNLCRYSDYFFEPLRASGVLAEVVSCAGDADPTTRKFACFALGNAPPTPYCCPYPCFYCTLKGGDLGNAAFHSAALYPALAPAIPPLVACLAEALDKTRSNAAGALGNLVRNDPPRTDRTRRVPHPVLIGHAASLGRCAMPRSSPRASRPPAPSRRSSAPRTPPTAPTAPAR